MQRSENQPSVDAARAARFEQMVQSARDGLITADVYGDITFVSAGAERMYGYPAEELLGRPIATLTPETERSTQAAIIARVRHGSAVGPVEVTRVRRDGSLIPVEMMAAPLWGVRGIVEGVLSVHRDLTARNEVAAALMESEARNRMLLEHTSDVVAHTRDGVVDWVSPAATMVLGRPPEELIGTRAAEYWHADDRDAVRSMRDAILAGCPGRGRFRWCLPSGEYRWLDVAGEAIPEADAHMGVVVTMRDVDAEVHAVARLAESESRFRRTMESASVPMTIAATDGRFIGANEALCQFFGRSEEEILRANWQELTHPDDLETDMAMAIQLFAGEITHYRLRKRFIHADGHTLWGDLSVAGVPDASGAIGSAVAQIVDVTASVEAERKLAETAELLHLVLDNADDGMLQFDRDCRVIYVNNRVTEMTGTPKERWLGSTLAEVGASAGRAVEHEAAIRATLATGETQAYEFELGSELGHRWYEARLRPVRNAEGEVTSVIETTRDITDRVGAQHETLMLATHDALTGLANRVEMWEDLSRAVAASKRSQRPTAVVLLDLDRFKFINDSLGHAVGDELLKSAAQRLLHVVRSGNLVVRPGGDEFVVVMRDAVSVDEVLAAAWRIVDAFRVPFEAGGADLFTTASVGVAIWSEGSTPQDLMREADIAMYRAKADGGDRIAIFNEELRDSVYRRVALEAQLRVALEASEIEVWFQPEIDLAEERVVAVEALARWRRPDGEVWNASEFIDVAEETGLILEIGEQVLRSACGHAAAWMAARPDQPVMLRVNLSALQLADEGCLDIIDDALSESGLRPIDLCVEITETVFLRGTKIVRENLEGIHARGIQIASDDFGTGYASLAQLREYPVDVIKIDQSFTADLVDDEQSRRLVAGTIALAHRLGMQVTAEGVEVQAQVEILREFECDTVQGFLFSKAVPAADLEAIVVGAGSAS